MLEDRIFSTLDQPFFSWGRGSQSEVFLSRDGEWVIKIPRNKKCRPYLLGRFRKNSRGQRGCLESYLTAARELADETAVLYVHRGEPFAMPNQFGLYDRLGRKMVLEPTYFSFALQKRKPLLSEKLEAANLEEAKKILSSLLNLIEAERQKGWVCSDYAFTLNFGYEDCRAFRIDIGSYLPVDASYSWKAIAKPIDKYLEHMAESSLQEWWHQEIAERQSHL